ncbi:tetraacyldisaccharide 4'-kinase [Helicobacter baculiformis]|uniref:Tetraacyldisaccharide 4'-kinase n=1 Tax=Helicobacter baculiformis TaxID=427351 RepID=A0ABV7ZJV5_9HELI|nr:tetraacyldisaccharide 4'-kinase [Helicobacter baculiformis]
MTWIERYFYTPSTGQKLLAYTLLPISLIYGGVATLKRALAPYEDLGVPIISIGNLVVGGSGKTPLILEIAKALESLHVGIVSRGYGRNSRGLVVVSERGDILVSQEEAGDEAFLCASRLRASVVVSTNRKAGVLKAKDLGAQVILLDDGFRFNFKKLNVVLKPERAPFFNFVLPSGAYREFLHAYKKADLLLQEGRDYTRKAWVSNPSPRMLLVTAIANPSRLDPYLPPVVGKLYFKDHARFGRRALEKAFAQYGATSLLVTTKDAVKLLDCSLPLSVLELQLQINSMYQEAILAYVLQN